MLERLKRSFQVSLILVFCTSPLPLRKAWAEDAPAASEAKGDDSKEDKKDAKDEAKGEAKGESTDAAATPPNAAEPPPDRGFNAALAVMAMTNSTDQGTAGPSGTTILSQFEFGYHYKYVGGGIYGQFDIQGSNQIDFLFGPKIEARYTLFFADVSFAPYMQRGFTDRSIARQVGNAWVFSVGVRVPVKLIFIKTLPKGTGFFLLASYKFRIQNIYYQDSTLLSDPLIQRDGYPLFGLGFRF